MIIVFGSSNLKLEVLIKSNKDRMGVGCMESGIPDFKDWHEVKRKKKEIFLPDGKIFLSLNHYVKFEPVNKVFEGIGASFFGKEIFKVWIGPDASVQRIEKLIAVSLEDGSWVISLPIHEEDDVTKFFFMTEDNQNLQIKISILTESGWKIRIVKVE